MSNKTRILTIASIVLLTALAFVSLEAFDEAYADESPSSHALYDSLNEAQQRVYDELYIVVDSMEGSCDASSLTLDEAIELMNVFGTDNPQFFWFADSYDCYHDQHKNPTTIRADDLDTETITQMRAEIDENHSEYLFKGSDLEKIRQIHDYLLRNIWYGNNDYDQNIYSALVLKETVCAGYSNAFTYLCKINGIDCATILGYVQTNAGPEYHAWNYVELEGKWYAMDLTWDDRRCPEDFEYDFFLIGLDTVVDGEVFKEVRSPDDEFGIEVEDYAYGDFSGYTSGVESWIVNKETVEERLSYKDTRHLYVGYQEIEFGPDTWPTLYYMMSSEHEYFSIAFKPTGSIEFDNGNKANIYRINAYLDDILVDPSDHGLDECISVYVHNPDLSGCALYDFSGEIVNIGFFPLDHSGSYFVGDVPFSFDILYIPFIAALVFMLIILAVIVIGRMAEVRKNKQKVSSGESCPKCGAKISKEYTYCIRCGAVLRNEEAKEPPKDDGEQL